MKFIRLAFCDCFGRPKNISIMPHELERAFKYGIAIDASAIAGFGDEVNSDLFLHPDASTIALLPWRPEHGSVVRMFCSITHPDGTPFAHDTRGILKQAVADAAKAGYAFSFGSELEFYLFRLDENGEVTDVPYDQATYMDVAPEDRCENVRREICLTLERMGIQPESSHHEEGPGQNEVDFRYSDPLSAADNAVTFLTVVKTIAARNGLYADFSPRPLEGRPGSGFHINMSVQGGAEALMHRAMGGILDKITDMTLFLNPTEQSYSRLGAHKAPKYISWSSNNRSQLIRVPAASGEYRRFELRSPDCTANPYLAFALIINAGLDGVEAREELPAPSVGMSKLALPSSLESAINLAEKSEFIKSIIPEKLFESYICHKRQELELSKRSDEIKLATDHKYFEIL